MQKGFSILEIVVVASIIILISSLILANQSSFGERLKIRSAAENIASSIRLAQAYGLGVKEFGAGSAIFPGYGIKFMLSAPSSYVFFSDSNADLLYNGSGELVENTLIQQPIVIYDLCADQKQAPPGPCGRAELTAVYLRPTPNVSLRSGVVSYSDIEIKIRSPKGFIKTIVLWQSGQISIE